MPLAVTHIMVPIIVMELFRDFYPQLKRYFSNKHVFLIGMAGILPDSDLVIYRIGEIIGMPVQESVLGHRIIFHNIWIPVGFLSFYFILDYLSKINKGRKSKDYTAFSKVFLVLFFGFTAHLLLDGILTGYVMPFYPLNEYMIKWDLVGKMEAFTSIPNLTILVSMDALLLMFWLWHQETEKHISDYF